MKEFSTTVGGKTLTVQIPGFATQANGEAIVRLGDTVVLVTAVMSPNPREGIDFFPLTVEFEERYYASGRLRSSRFVKREAKPPDDAILAGRLVDRSIRPRFPKGMRNDVQVVATTLSYDDEHDPDVLAIIGASTALMVSDIPWNGPIAAVRIAEVKGATVLNPTQLQRQEASFELVVSGDVERINMLEGGAQSTPEEKMLAAVEEAHHAVVEIEQAISRFKEEHGKEKTPVVLIEPSLDARDAVRAFIGTRLEDALFAAGDKTDRMDRVNQLKKELLAHFAEGDVISHRDASSLFEEEIDHLVHKRALEKSERVDGRRLDQLRDLEAAVGVLPRTHGSAMFTRGNTRALATVTLAAPGEEMIVEGMEGESRKPFLLHYNFPPFSVGDVKPMRGPGRREIGHGALAERSVVSAIPLKETFPYTIRVVSEILSSNGSSSMATVCAASLALMDAGVPIGEHVAGIAMGLMTDPADKSLKQRYRVLTDIQGPEDHHGDMDLKIAGTRRGVTGLQMDVKIDGITVAMLKDTFAQARKAREEIIKVLEKALPTPRPTVGTYAPKVVMMKINPEKIRDLIGPGGRVINGIIARTGARIDVEDSGDVFVTGTDADAVSRTVEEVKNVTKEAAVGETFKGTVARLFPFGVMVELFSGQSGLIHMNDLRPLGLQRPEDAFRMGMEVDVTVKEIDAEGRANLVVTNPDSLEIRKSGGGDFRHHDDRRGGRRPFRPFHH